MTKNSIQPASRVAEVRYEIRGPLARRAHELEAQGHEILHLNVGNPGAFGLHAPETMREAIVRNLKSSDAYGPQTGIFPAREAVAIQFQERGLELDRDGLAGREDAGLWAVGVAGLQVANDRLAHRLRRVQAERAGVADVEVQDLVALGFELVGATGQRAA